MRRFFSIISMSSLCACVVAPVEGRQTFRAYAFGLVAVDRMYTENAAAESVSIIGLWADGAGAGAGATTGKQVALNDKCRIVFLVENKKQMKSAIALLQTTFPETGGGICEVEF